MIPTAGKNVALDALGITHVGAHNAWPGETGASAELSGGSPAYARKAITFAAAANASKAASTQPLIDVPAGQSVAWLSGWTQASGGECRLVTPAGGEDKEITVDVAADTVRSVAHGYGNGQTVVFYGGTVPGGLTEGTIYYVRDATADTFRVAATVGGAAIDLTSEPGAACVVSKIVVETYAAQGQYQVTGLTAALTH